MSHSEYPASRVSSIFLDQSGRGRDSASAFDISYWACSKLKCNRASPSLTLRTKLTTLCSRKVSRELAFREHFDSHGFHAVQFNREFAQRLQLAKNTDKEVFFRIRSKVKDTICLVCAISLIGERCTFNIEQHSGLRQKLESVLEHDIDFKASSSRICRPCGPWKKIPCGHGTSPGASGKIYVGL